MSLAAARLSSLLLSALLLTAPGCQGALETDAPPPDPDSSTDPDTDPDPTPDPDPDPAQLTAAEVQEAFNGAVLAALSGPQTGVTVDEGQTTVRIDGELSQGDALVGFNTLVLTRAPFGVTGVATVQARGERARIAFGGDTTGQVSLDGAPLGSIEADFPPLDDFASDTSFELLGLAIDCQGLDLGQVDGVVSLDGSCQVADADGNPVGSIDINGVDIDLIDLSATGSIVIDANGTVIELILNGATADLIVDGEAVGSADLGDLLGGLL